MTLTLTSILAADQFAANEVSRHMQLAAGSGDGGQYTFIQPIYALAATDDSTPVQFWTAINFQPEYKAQAQSAMSQFPGATMEDYDPIANPGFPDQWLAANNLRRALPKLP